MECYRCGGRMVREAYFSEGKCLSSSRCVCCGDIVDQVSFRDRTAPALSSQESRNAFRGGLSGKGKSALVNPRVTIHSKTGLE